MKPATAIEADSGAPPGEVLLEAAGLQLGYGSRTVLAEVKGDPILRKIPIAIFSTSDAKQDILRSYELGANCYVSKPGNLRDFISAVTMIGQFWVGLARLPREEER